jgi:leucine dehydrogenase
MSTFKAMQEFDHEQVSFCYDKSAGLKAIIAIHDTTLGPGLGGARMWNYASEEEALVDVLRLSRGMTYKAAAAGLNLGGGKAVIIADPKRDKSEALFRAFGRFVEGLSGRYITAEDVGTSVADMEFVLMETKYVTGIAPAHGGSGDPSPVTAYGVYKGMKACVEKKLGRNNLDGLRIAIQGLGSVGFNLIPYLKEEFATLIGCDIDADKCARAAEQGVEVVDPEAIYDVDCDIFAPCALGAILNDNTLPRLKCQIVAGGANNQLAEERHGDELKKLGVLYAPDYVINAGGLINVYVEMEGYVRERALRMAEIIYTNLLKIFDIAKREDIPTYIAADRMAEERIRTIGRLKRFS